LKVEAAIMAQVIDGVDPVDYLNEGNKIMKDSFEFIK
jgi:hypothetical protein